MHTYHTLPCHTCYWTQNQKLKDVHESLYMQSADHQGSICSRTRHHVLGLQSETYLTKNQKTVIKIIKSWSYRYYIFIMERFKSIHTS